MVKKVLVSKLEPVIQGLKDDGLDITRADLMPSELNTYYTLAISANWKKLSRMDRHGVIWNKIQAFIPDSMSKHILNIYTYNRPEEIEADMPLFAQWETPKAGISLM